MLSLTGVIIATSAPALALQGGEDASTLPVLIDKRFGNRGHLDVHLQFSTPIVAKFVESTGVTLGVNYSITDWLAVGALGGFFGGGETDIVEPVRLNQSGGTAPLTDLYRMVWVAGADVTFTPLYGRISFASEYNPAFDVFGFVGGGAMGTERQLAGETETTDTTFYGNLGFGFRFHILDFLAIRTEYRQFIYPDPDIPQSERAGRDEPDGGSAPPSSFRSACSSGSFETTGARSFHREDQVSCDDDRHRARAMRDRVCPRGRRAPGRSQRARPADRCRSGDR
ncbi:MAG: outer membrane beta-barrel domain-containing protein [Myxococcales bacterium]|nr:outer membrane beta-barrel domain-containing protein [Myxococcales bacterium]